MMARPTRVSLVVTGVLSCLLLTATSDLRAETYGVPIQIQSAEELQDLLENGELEEDAFIRLYQLLVRPLDLNTATRDQLFDLPGLTPPMVDQVIQFREEGQRFNDASDLGSLGIPMSIVNQCRVFIKRVRVDKDEPPPVSGDARWRLITPLEDHARPATDLRIRTRILDYVDVGISALVQDQVGALSYHGEDHLGWYSAPARDLRADVPKFYVDIDRPQWQLIVGTYSAGFAERLVFDESVRRRPHGLYADHEISINSDVATRTHTYDDAYSADEIEEFSATSARLTVNERLMGLGARLKRFDMGEGGTIDATLFLSWWPYDAYQGDLDSYRRDDGLLDDTRFDGASNPLYCQEGEPGYETACALEGNGKLSYETFKDAYSELIVGGNVEYAPLNVFKFGVTAYYAMVDWLVSDDLHWATSASYPSDRDEFGAMGISAEGRFANVVLSGEYARTFNGQNAAILRSVLGFEGLDLEIHGRYYDRDFDNPHARGHAYSDELDGQRDRDEVGGGVQLTAYPTPWFIARINAEVWYRPTLETVNLFVRSRASAQIADWCTMSLGMDLVDKDLEHGGRGADYGGELAAGMSLTPWLQLRFDPLQNLSLTLRYRMRMYDKSVSDSYDAERSLYYSDHFAIDHLAVLQVRARLTPNLTLTTRLKYEDDEIKYLEHGLSALEGYLQIRWKIIKELSLSMRYDLRGYLDERATRLSAEPTLGALNRDTEHLLRAELALKF